MGYYLMQWAYKVPQIKAMIEKPQDREAAAAKAVEAFKGKLHGFYFAFGEYDGCAVAEFPDNESAAASLLTIGGGGAVSKLHTTVLLTSAEAERAMKKAHGTKSGYKAPAD
ncbi:MAG: GYD domain-containing protein [Dongiaceae bacterium]